MKRKMVLSIFILISLIACSMNKKIPQKSSFKAEIIEVYDDSFLVVPTKEFEHIASRIIVTRTPQNTQKKLNFKVGEIISITHDGLILESDPAQLSVVYEIHLD